MKKIILLYAYFFLLATSISAQCTLKVAIDTIIHPSCPGQNNGAISLKTTNGRAPFTYNWAIRDIQLDMNRQQIINVAPEKYSVTVTDAAGCRDSILNIIVKNDTSFVTYTTTPTTNGLDGKATVTFTIGTNAYTREFTNLKFGDNTVFITHPRGCSISLVVKIAGPMTCGLKLAVDSIYQPSCYGQPTGRIIVKTSNAILPLTYHWTNYPNDIRTTIQSAFVLPSISVGVYGVKVTDAMGCRDSLLNLIVKEDTPKITITTTPTTNGRNGTATVTVTVGKEVNVLHFTNLKIGDTSLVIGLLQPCPYGNILITITGTTPVNDLYTEGVEQFDIVQNSAHQASVFIKFKENKRFDLSVFSVNGQQIAHQSLNGQEMQVDLQDLPSGVLLFSLKMKEKIITKKVVLLK